MQSLIEALQYRLPTTGYLDSRFNRTDLLKRDWVNYDRLLFVDQMGFRLSGDLTLRKGNWEIWERPHFAIPKFPEGETVTHSRLGLYRDHGRPDYPDQKDGYKAAILRTSCEFVSEEEFKRDLASLTRLYIERPHLWGFPSRLMTADGWQHIAVGIGGAVLGGAIGFFATGELTYAGLGTGLIAPSMGLSGILHASSEWWAKKHIPAINQYMSGQTAEATLVEEQVYITTALIQREVYTALQNEGFAITPEKFLQIYAQMPYSLRQRRAVEIIRARRGVDDSGKIPEVVLPNMVGVARAILAVA